MPRVVTAFWAPINHSKMFHCERSNITGLLVRGERILQCRVRGDTGSVRWVNTSDSSDTLHCPLSPGTANLYHPPPHTTLAVTTQHGRPPTSSLVQNTCSSRLKIWHLSNILGSCSVLNVQIERRERERGGGLPIPDPQPTVSVSARHFIYRHPLHNTRHSRPSIEATHTTS